MQKYIYFSCQRRWNEGLCENVDIKQPLGQEKDTHDNQENIFIGCHYKHNSSPWKDSLVFYFCSLALFHMTIAKIGSQ